MEGQQLGQGLPQLRPGDDLIHKAVLLQIFSALEALSGSSWPMVCRMTRGPAKPMRAPGSARVMSPREAKLAVTPPVVGWV